MEAKKFNPNDYLISLKGKDYLQVMWRLVWFREEKPNWCINTEKIEISAEHAIFKCIIFDDKGVQVCAGHGSETKKDFGDFIEKAETKAVGRALAMLGYGTQFAPELDEGERIVDSPVSKPEKTTETYKCMRCEQLIKDHKGNNGITLASEIAKRSLATYGTQMCYSCSLVKKKTNEANGS